MNFWHGARTKYQFFASFISPMDFTNQKPLSRGQGQKNYNLLTKKNFSYYLSINAQYPARVARSCSTSCFFSSIFGLGYELVSGMS